MRTDRNDRTAPPVARGFTLSEIIVAIGLLAIVGVVIGTIFASVGDTVTQGREVSNLNRFVARVERTMRRDFENMVRENGFMVIRNETTNLYNGSNPLALPVALTVTDSAPRARRIDEIMFFSRGEFSSRRTPLHPDMIARSDVARVYYGHGQQMPEDFGGDPDNPVYTTPYARPRVDESNTQFPDTRLGQPSSLGVINPNEFASDWALLRHVTLLVPRQTGVQDLPADVLGLRPNINPVEYNRVADSSRQVALGPAAQSVFRSVSAMTPYELFPLAASGNLMQPNPINRNIRPVNGFTATLNGGADSPGNETLARPLASSGIVDVAVTTLDEIRDTVTHAWIRRSLAGLPEELGPRTFTPYDYSTETDRFGVEAGRTDYDQNGRPRISTAIAQTNPNPYGSGPPPVAQNQQRWMFDALPSVPFDPVNADRTGHRVRFEDIPPRVFVESATEPATDEIRRQLAIEQADQEMLASSVFVPRCTEFIVEFSFGMVDRRTASPNYGQQLWHGLRRLDPNGQVIVDEFWDRWGNLDLADNGDPNLVDNFDIRGAFPSDAFEDGNFPQNNAPGGIDREILELIRFAQRFAPDGNPNDDVIAEYAFGYGYRDFNEDQDGDGVLAGDGDDRDRTWPWPSMIRITMRFVDPGDLEREQTFQFEFRVPGVRGRL